MKILVVVLQLLGVATELLTITKPEINLRMTDGGKRPYLNMMKRSASTPRIPSPTTAVASLTKTTYWDPCHQPS